MSVTTAGVLAGTPTATGTYNFTIVGTDGVQTIQQSETIVVYNPLIISTGVLGGGTVGTAYSAQLASSGGSGTVTWSGGGGGLTVMANGTIAGTPAIAGPASVTVTATDAVTGQIVMATYAITINPPALNYQATLVSEVAVGAAVSGSATATGGTPPYSFSSANAPTGISVNASTGAVSGSIATPGVYLITFTVADSGSQGGQSTLTLQVFGVSTLSAPNATAGNKYSYTLATAGSSGPVTWSATSLPPGLNLSATGVLSGTPLTGGTYKIPVTIGDGIITTTGTVTITVNGTTPLAVPASTTLTAAQVNVGYLSLLSAAGGAPSY